MRSIKSKLIQNLWSVLVKSTLSQRLSCSNRNILMISRSIQGREFEVSRLGACRFRKWLFVGGDVILPEKLSLLEVLLLGSYIISPKKFQDFSRTFSQFFQDQKSQNHLQIFIETTLLFMRRDSNWSVALGNINCIIYCKETRTF